MMDLCVTLGLVVVFSEWIVWRYAAGIRYVIVVRVIRGVIEQASLK
jgi:hypothetical protein